MAELVTLGVPVAQSLDDAFGTIALAAGQSMPAAMTAVHVLGYSSPGDGGGAIYVRAASEPAHGLKFQSSDGAWWELVAGAGGVGVSSAGALGDGVADDGAAVSGALEFWATRVLFPDGVFKVGSGALPLSGKTIWGSAGAALKGTTALRLMLLGGRASVEGLTFDTFLNALYNLTAADPAVTLRVDDSRFLNGASSAINIEAPIADALVRASYFKTNKGPVIRFGKNDQTLQAGWGPAAVIGSVIDGVTSGATAGTVGGILSYTPGFRAIGNHIENVVGGVGDEVFGTYVKARHSLLALQVIRAISSAGTTTYGINLKGAVRGDTSDPQGYAAVAALNTVIGGASSLVTGLQMQADQQAAIGNFFDEVLSGIEIGSPAFSGNVGIGNRTHSNGGSSSRGVTAASGAATSQVIDALGWHLNVRIGVRYVTTGSGTIDRLLITDQLLESDAAPGAQAVIVSAATPGQITDVQVRNIRSKNHSRAVDLDGVYGGVIENIRATGLTTATRPIETVNCKNIAGRNVWRYSVTTTNASATLVYQQAISDGNRLVIRVRAHARKSDGTTEAYVEREFLFDMEGGTAALVASGTARTLGAGAVGGLSAGITSNRCAVYVTGIAAETWDWDVASVDFDLL